MPERRKPWIEIRLTQASMIWPNASTIPVWPICWQGWFLCAALPLSWLLEFWLAFNMGWHPGSWFWTCLFAGPILAWFAIAAVKTEVSDEC